MKFKKIYLHIGLHKTGSSSIQSFLYNNRQILEKNHSIYVPLINKNMGGILLNIFGNPKRKCTIKTNSDSNPRTLHDEYKSKLINELASTHCEYLILSGEAISLFKTEELLQLKNFLTAYSEEIIVILYVRSPIKWALSKFQQDIKAGVGSLSDDLPTIKYKKIINKFIDIFTIKNLVINDFDSVIHPLDTLILSFFKSMSPTISEELFTSKTEIINKSLSYEAVQLIDIINKSGCVREAYDVTPFLNLTGKKLSLNDTSIMKLKSITIKDLEWLKDNFSIDYTNSFFTPPIPNTSAITFNLNTIKELALSFHDIWKKHRKLQAVVRAERYLCLDQLDKAKAVLIKQYKVGDFDFMCYKSLIQIELLLKNQKNAVRYIHEALQVASPLEKKYLQNLKKSLL